MSLTILRYAFCLFVFRRCMHAALYTVPRLPNPHTYNITQQPQDHTRVHILGTRLFDTIHVPPPAGAGTPAQVRVIHLWLFCGFTIAGITDIPNRLHVNLYICRMVVVGRTRRRRWSCRYGADPSRWSRPCTGTRSVDSFYVYTKCIKNHVPQTHIQYTLVYTHPTK